MLVSIIERFQEGGDRDVDRYAAWSASLRQLREDFNTGKLPEAGPQLRDYLADVPEEQWPGALQDLIAEHLKLAWKNGQGTILETYFAEFGEEFPEWASPGTAPADLVEDEFLARYQSPHGDAPPLDDYRNRFPGRTEVIEALDQRFFDDGRRLKLNRRGIGAMGEVWEVFDSLTRLPTAMKEPRGNSAIPGRFAGEAAVTAGLEHRGIVNLRESHRKDGTAFYTMRLVDGESLTDRIGACHQPPSHRTSRENHELFRELLKAFASACDAVASAHSGGVLHRDLKPGNVIVEASGEAAILDWGMAERVPGNALQSLSKADEKSGSNVALEKSGCNVTLPLAGTPEYMAPEQADGIADDRSDVFGLGAILYEILTGGPPRPWGGGARPADWANLVRRDEFPRPRRLNARTPRALEAICMKALAHDPDERYQSAGELAGDVRAYLVNSPVTAYAEPVLARVWRLLRGR